MNTNFKFLFSGAGLFLIPLAASAQCIATTDCATLGYTETSCPNGKGIKCPFGDTWACPTTETEFCEKYGFKYDCSGSGYKGGGESSCNGKYAFCNCQNGYEWKDGKCQRKSMIETSLGYCSGYAKFCRLGQLLNSDGTCTDKEEPNKKPIGTVAYISVEGCGQAIAPVTSAAWSTVDNETGAFSTISAEEAWNDFDSCGNTQKIIQNGDKSKYPAAWAAVDYAPENAPETKGLWCLPAAGVFHHMYENRNVFTDDWYSRWSSTESSAWNAWELEFDDKYGTGGIVSSRKDNGNREVWAVIEF